MEQKVEQKVKKIGKYEIVSELGQGGMGVVYKARDPFIGRMVALKTITPELVTDQEILKRFYREAQSAGTLQHPNIVTIFDLGEADGCPYIAMEFVEGESLQKIIERRARIPLAAKLKVVQQFCEGLAHAHKHGFVHRDVKPANILVTHEGTVKVVDFGIVHLESTNLTKTGMFLGTIHYASPEQINDGRVDSRSDLWSVTAVFYEFIAYKKAFDGSNIAAIIAKVLSTDPEPLSRSVPGIPPELDAVISKGLKKNIEERYQSLDEMLGDVLPIARSLQQSFIGDLLMEAKDLRDKGEIDAAIEKVKGALMLDNTHGEAKRLNFELEQLRQQMGPLTRAKRLVGEAEQAFSRGEYDAAARLLGEAQGLNPADTQARRLLEKTLQHQERQRELRERLTAGQRAMKQGDLTSAEQELHRVIQLDENNAQAAELLEKIRQDRLARERDFRLKEALWQADNLISAGKYDEAQSRLLELQQDFAASDEINQKLQILDPLVRSRKLAKEGEQAFNQQEYAEAVRALNEAIELNPQDARARQLRDLALQERDRLRQVREALSAGQRAMRQGDLSAAEAEFQKALQLDPNNAQATSLLAQGRQMVSARERDSRFRQALQQADNLVAQGKLEEAQRALLELQQEFPDSAEIDQKLAAVDQKTKIARLVSGGRTAFDQGEFGEAVKLLKEAQELAPHDAQIRELREKAEQGRVRLRQVREAISSGQSAMRQADYVAAEREFQRALQLDPENAQAKNLLAQAQKEREKREREKRLQEALAQADKLINAKKWDQAQRKLSELQQAYPDAEEVHQKLQVLNERKREAMAPPLAPPVVQPPVPAPPPRGAPISEVARSLQSAEELRRSLEKPRVPEAVAPTRPVPSPGETLPVQFPPLQAVAGPEAPPAESPAGVGSATAMMSSLGEQARAGQPTIAPPLPPPVVQPPAPVPPPRLEPPRKAGAVIAPPRPTPAPVVKPPSSKMPIILGVVAVVVVALGIAIYKLTQPSGPKPQPGNNNPPPVVTLTPEQKEKDLRDKAKAALDAKDYPGAAKLYSQAADLGGPLKQEDLEDARTAAKAGTENVAQVEQDEYNHGVAALAKKDYATAQRSFNSVVQLNVPGSTLVPKAQDELAKLQPILQDKADWDRAVATDNRGDYPGALTQFKAIAAKPGTYQAEANARIPKLQQKVDDAAKYKDQKAQLDAAIQLETNAGENIGNLNGARDKFQAVAALGGPFGDDAKKHIQDITQRIGGLQDKQTSQDALAAENANRLDEAQTLWAKLSNSPNYKDQAQVHLQQIRDKKDAAASEATYQEAIKKANSPDVKDVKDALNLFKALAAKPGPRQSDAINNIGPTSEKIARLTSPPPPPPPPTQTTTPTPSTTTAHNPVVTALLPQASELTPLTLPYRKGMMVPAKNVEGGVQAATNLSMPPVPGAPPASLVAIKLTLDENGDVAEADIVSDTSSFGSEVQKAARSWKFKPPTAAKGKPVRTSFLVRVTF